MHLAYVCWTNQLTLECFCIQLETGMVKWEDDWKIESANEVQILVLFLQKKSHWDHVHYRQSCFTHYLSAGKYCNFSKNTVVLHITVKLRNKNKLLWWSSLSSILTLVWISINMNFKFIVLPHITIWPRWQKELVKKHAASNNCWDETNLQSVLLLNIHTLWTY